MRILALDQSSRVTGYAIFEDNKLIKSGKFDASYKRNEINARLVFIREKLLELIKEYKIDKVYYEEIQLQKTVLNNIATFKILSEVIGVISETCKEIEMSAISVYASAWKTALGIPTREKRQVQKKLTQDYVKQYYNLKVTEDESDAIGIGTYAISQLGYNIPKLNKQEKIDIIGFDWSE